MAITNFADRLIAAVKAKKSQVCVGLDPKVERLPAALLEKYRREPAGGCGCGRKEVAEAFEEFCTGIIEAVAPHAVAVKLQLACFEQYGPPGFRAFRHLVRTASRAGLVVIADAKRGDIGISAASYSAAFIGQPEGLDGKLKGLEIDAMTVNPFFGSDGVKPFLDDCRRLGKGIFVLVKTSNPGSAELQDLKVAGGRRLYEHLAEMVAGWGMDLVGESGYSSVGAVVGATHREALPRIRELLPRSIFLLPGYGAQGAAAADLAPAFDEQGQGAIVTASRSIIYAEKDGACGAAAADAARRMQAELWEASH